MTGILVPKVKAGVSGGYEVAVAAEIEGEVDE